MILKKNGFTLVELLVALALTGIVMAAVYRSFSSQQRVYVAQDEVASMQQDLRAVMDMMIREIRMAGYDPTSSNQASILVPLPFGFVSMPNPGGTEFGRYTSTDGIAFTTDREPPPPPVGNTGTMGTVDASDSEQVAFRLNVDQNGNALAPGALDGVLRKYSTGAVRWQPMAENIDALNFVYLDANGVVIPTPVTGANLNNIRSVQITIVARAARADRNYTNITAYRNQQNAVIFGPANDGLRRRLLTATVTRRNL